MNARRLQSLKLNLAPALFRALAATIRVRREGEPPAGACVFASLHRDMLPAILAVRPYRPYLLVSRSLDGEVLIRTLGRDFGFVRGSTGKEGGTAFRALLARLREGRGVGIAVDGPRGPFGKVHEGGLRLAQHSGLPVVPVHVTPGRHLSLKTWDRTVVPAPFSSLDIRFGEPLLVGPGDEALAAAVGDLHTILLNGEAAP